MRTSVLIAAAAVIVPGVAHATPSTNFWAPSTPAIQGFGVLHVSYDTYFADDALYPVDMGLTMGVLPWKELQLELGADVLYPTLGGDDGLAVPIYFNAKLGTPEDTLFANQPGWAVGIYSLGIEPDVTDYDITYLVIGKTLPCVGTLSIGGYYGRNGDLLVDPDGDSAQAGLMAGWASPSIAVPKIDHLALAADVQTGSNSYGAVGGGAAIYFTPAVALLTGPVIFLAPDLQPGGNRWMWSAQLDVDVDLGLAPGGQ